MKRSRWWLLIAALLLGLAAWLMRTKKPLPETKHVADSAFPRHPHAKDQERRHQREVDVPAKPDAKKQGPTKRDPFLAALPPLGGDVKTAIVVETAALKSLPVGRMFLKCIKNDGEEDRMMKRTGLSPDQIDRVAVTDNLALVEGDFSKLDWDALTLDQEKAESYGPNAKIGGANGRFFGVYQDKYMMMGKSREDVERAIDRMENGESGPPAIPEESAYGEIYGVLGVDKLAQILEREQPDLAERLRTAADRVELHVDASEDVLMVADVTGPDGASVGDLGKTFGGALALGRMQAKATEDAKLAELLEQARVRPHEGQFAVDVALPLPLIEKELGKCAKGWNE